VKTGDKGPERPRSDKIVYIVSSKSGGTLRRRHS
jgi:hypothetical protein